MGISRFFAFEVDEASALSRKRNLGLWVLDSKFRYILSKALGF